MSDLIDRIPASCSTCPHMEVNYHSDETYCMINDGREISLGRGQRKPKWCPLNGVLPSEQPEQRWIPVTERLPEKPGVYLVTVFNREWNKEGTDIVQGAKPPKDEYWDDHKNLYAERQDGKWVVTEKRVWTGECWSGYGEIQLAWMEMPAPYTEEDNE